VNAVELYADVLLKAVQSIPGWDRSVMHTQPSVQDAWATTIRVDFVCPHGQTVPCTRVVGQALTGYGVAEQAKMDFARMVYDCVLAHTGWPVTINFLPATPPIMYGLPDEPTVVTYNGLPVWKDFKTSQTSKMSFTPLKAEGPHVTKLLTGVTATYGYGDGDPNGDPNMASKKIPALFPQLAHDDVSCPGFSDGAGLSTEGITPFLCQLSASPLGLITHLNDDHHWTREAIADWLETLDRDITLHQKPNKEENPYANNNIQVKFTVDTGALQSALVGINADIGKQLSGAAELISGDDGGN
jgi:hypothetical protein